MNTKIYFLLLTLITFSCHNGKLKIIDSTIKIKPYQEKDNGKFWEICIKSEDWGLHDKPVAFFEIHSDKNSTYEYIIDFIHLEKECNNKNILVNFTNRHTPLEEFNWLKNLNSENIEYIKFRVKRNYEDINYIYEKNIYSKDLK